MGENQQTGILSRPSLVHYTVDTKKAYPSLPRRFLYIGLTSSHRVRKSARIVSKITLFGEILHEYNSFSLIMLSFILYDVYSRNGDYYNAYITSYGYEFDFFSTHRVYPARHATRAEKKTRCLNNHLFTIYCILLSFVKDIFEWYTMPSRIPPNGILPSYYKLCPR